MKNSIQKVRVGIIGGGAIAEIYHLPALQSHSRTCDSIVVADTNTERLATLREKFTLADTVEDYRQLAGKVDAVVVATPPASHFPICKWCLENGLHVLCEKPLTEDIAEAKELVTLAKNQNLRLVVNQTRRHFPTYQKIRELIRSGTLGELNSITYHDGVEFDWPAATPHHFAPSAKGAWSDTGVHLLDTIAFWLGDGLELKESFNDSLGGPEAMATVRLTQGACDVEIKVSRLGRLKNGFEIVGTNATIEAEAEEWSEVVVRYHSGGIKRHRCGSRKRVYTDFAVPMLEDFLDSVNSKRNSLAAAESVLPTVELLDEAYRRVEPYRMNWNNAEHLNWSNDLELPGIEQVLVTGASGFLGGRIVDLMHDRNWAKPVGMIRQWSRAARISRRPVESRLCDITKAEQVEAAVEGVQAIVHCAKTDDRESIVGGTRHLLDAALRNGVKKFVFISTAEVYGPEVTGEVLESQATPQTGRLYGDAKVEAEQVCMEYAEKGLQVVVLRPSLIYGPFSTSWSTDIAKRLLSGNWGTFEDHGNGFANLVYVDDLIQAIMRCLSRETVSGSAYNVNGPDKLTWNSYFQKFNDLIGSEPLPAISATKSRLRTWVMDRVSQAADLVLNRYEDKLMEIYLRGGWPSKIMKRIKGELTSTPSAGELNDLFSRQAYYSDAKARQELGYRPNFDIDSGIAQTVCWLRLHEVVSSDAAAVGFLKQQVRSTSVEAEELTV
ncbi:MAG: NAD-dependent epimerase/dehydratase family protein [Pirellulaceae bacterium]